MLYKRAVVNAISELHDSSLRSNIDSIRRRVQSTLDEMNAQRTTTTTIRWNEAIFLKALKSLVKEGVVEQCTNLNCGLSPVFKRNVSSKAQAAASARNNSTVLQPPSLTGMAYPIFEHHYEPEYKVLPVKKSEHYKLKICPKKLYDLQQ